MSTVIDRVWMVHPEVEGSGRWMPRTAMPFHAAAGWVEADPPPEPRDKPDAKKASAKKQTPRRPSTEGQD